MPAGSTKVTKPTDRRRDRRKVIGTGIRTLGKPSVQGITEGIDGVKLYGDRGIRAVIGPHITDAKLERTIEGASTVTLTVEDGERLLLQSPIANQRADIEVDGLWFRLVKVARRGYTTELTFEDREVARLRKKGKAMRVVRGKVTRAEFIKRMVRQVPGPPIPFYCPELHKPQPIATQKQGRRAKRTEPQSGGKFTRKMGLTVKGRAATPVQLQNGERVLGTAASLKAPELARVALVMATIAETTMLNLSGGDASSTGILQLLASTATSMSIDPRDIEAVSEAFLKRGFYHYGGAIRLARSIKDPAEIAARVQGNAAGAASFRPWRAEAEKWVKKFGNSSGDVTVSLPGKYHFKKGKKESPWDASGRLAEEVGWRRFVVAGTLIYMSEVDLYESAVRAEIGADTPGVDEVSFTYDIARPTTDLSITGRAEQWRAPPGTVIELYDYGPADGRYIVESIISNFFNEDVDIRLKKPTAELPEPAPERKEKTIQGKDKASKSGDASASALADVKIGRTGSGAPGWGGTADIFMQFVHPFMRRKGLSPGGQKEGGHASGGDHDPSVGNAYATDYPTYNGLGIAREFARACGASSWSANSYNTFNIRVDGRSFRVQLLWGGGIDHGDHIHVGIRSA